jgi:hypothetical protein
MSRRFFFVRREVSGKNEHRRVLGAQQHRGEILARLVRLKDFLLEALLDCVNPLWRLGNAHHDAYRVVTEERVSAWQQAQEQGRAYVTGPSWLQHRLLERPCTPVTLRPAALAMLYRARGAALRLPAVRAPVVFGSALASAP